jgi:uncharacterized protein (TIGR02186 family)
MVRLVLILLLFAPLVAAQESVVGKLSQNQVSITADFVGSEIFVFGAVKRFTPIPPDVGPLNIVITVRGPTEPVTVRRKERVLGIWVNRTSMVVDEAASFYAIASSGPLDEVMSTEAQMRYGIGVNRVVTVSGPIEGIRNPTEFREAVIRINSENGLYTQQDGAVELLEETLFSTSVALPSNLTEGVYVTRMYLLRDREVINISDTAITVRKEGLEQWIYALAHEQPWIYGILTIVIALMVGWSASEAFRVILKR